MTDKSPLLNSTARVGISVMLETRALRSRSHVRGRGEHVHSCPPNIQD
jgi:hypothetical protein